MSSSFSIHQGYLPTICDIRFDKNIKIDVSTTLLIFATYDIMLSFNCYISSSAIYLKNILQLSSTLKKSREQIINKKAARKQA